MNVIVSNDIEIVEVPAISDSNPDKLVFSHRTGAILRMRDSYMQMLLEGNFQQLPYALINLLIKNDVLSDLDYETGLNRVEESLINGTDNTNFIYSYVGDKQQQMPLILVNRHRAAIQHKAYLFLPVNQVPVSALVFKNSLKEILIQLFRSQAMHKKIYLIVDLQDGYEAGAFNALMNLIEQEIAHNDYLRIVKIQVCLALHPGSWSQWTPEILEIIRHLNRNEQDQMNFFIKVNQNLSLRPEEEEFIDFAYTHSLLKAFVKEIRILPVRGNLNPDKESDILFFISLMISHLDNPHYLSSANMTKRILYTAVNKKLINPC